jgi:hypothetical protein
VLTFKPHKLAFPAEQFGNHTGAASPTLKVKVTNPNKSTNAPVQFNSPEIDDPGSDFVIDGALTTCTDGFILNPGSHCFLGLKFQPTSVGPHAGTLQIHNNAQNTPQAVTLSGTGKSPHLTINPVALAFGKVPVGTPSAEHVVTLKNTGKVPIAISSIAPSDPSYAVAGDSTCGSVLSNVPGSNTCTVGVIFTPAAPGSVPASLAITDDAAHSPQTVALSGKGK